MHFSLFVCISKKDRPKFEDAVAKRLAPFDGEKRRNSKNAVFDYDWYQIGGRWTGILDGYTPETDPKNIEKCTFCHATGIRTDGVGQANGFPTKALEPAVAKEVGRTHGYCNGCDSRGNRPKWPTEFPVREGDVQPATTALKCLKEPFAIVDLDGRGFVSEKFDGRDFVKAENWTSIWRDVVSAAAKKDAFVVIVDCHT